MTQTVIQLCPAAGAKFQVFLVQVLYIGTGAHYTCRIVAMDQAESMAQFMYHNFSETFDQQEIITFKAI